MKVLVAVPFRPSSQEREVALSWVLERWHRDGFETSVGEPPEGPWNKALAVRAAIDGSDADILIVSDADVYCSGVDDAVNAVHRGAPWAKPHKLLHRLSPASTALVLAGTEPRPGMELDPDYPLSQRRGRTNQGWIGVDGGGIVVLHRDTYDDTPLDPRFQGWGHEDTSWARALTKLHGGPTRFAHDLFHLWHPRQEWITWGLGSVESDLLGRRYEKARTPEAMRALVDEAREVTLC